MLGKPVLRGLTCDNLNKKLGFTERREKKTHLEKHKRSKDMSLRKISILFSESHRHFMGKNHIEYDIESIQHLLLSSYAKVHLF